MSSMFSVYCISSVAAPPIALSRRKDCVYFYCHIPVPVPEQLIVFCEGDWENDDDLDVNLTYKDEEICMGQVSKANRCLVWKRDPALLPDVMKASTEKGLAKIVVEKGEGCPLLVNIEDGQISEDMTHHDDIVAANENTPQIEEGSVNTPDRPIKNKRKTSLTKGEKTPNGPSAKKQKVNKTNTRIRTPKVEGSPKLIPEIVDNKISSKVEAKTTKTNSKIEKEKSENSPKHSKEVQTTKDDSKESKTNTKGEKTVKAKTPKGNKKLDKENSEKDAKQELSDTDTVMTEIKVQNDGEVKEKKIGRKKSETLVNKSKDKAVGTPEAVKKERKSKRTKTEDTKVEDISANIENKCQTEPEKCDKENVHVDRNVPVVDEIIKTINSSPIKELKTTPLNNLSKEKMASCKDLTSRTLARPSGRWGHSLCFINKNLSILIGGQGEKQQLNKDSVWSLDTETRRWRNPSTQSEGQKPEYRMGHTATYDPMVRCVYVFGGSKNTRWFHDVHMLDVEDWKWTLVKVDGKAPTRAYHSATLYRHELWIFGGVYPRPDPQPDGCSNDIHIFSPVMESWYSPIVKGEKPIPRSGHSATLLNDQLVVFGGWDAPISYQDLHVLDMSIVEWSQPEISGTPPSPRSWHASCALSNNRLLINGGYNGDIALEDTHIFNLDNLTWSQIHVDNSPAARVGHKALCMPYRHDNDEEDEVIIFGGGDNDGAYFEDLLSIYVPFEPAAVTC